MLTLITIILILILSGLCSCSETALYSISLAKVQKLASEKSRSAKILLKIKNNMEKYIGSIVFSNNAINIFGASFLTGIVIKEYGDGWVNFFTAILTLLIIIFSEIIPKNLGEKKSINIAPLVAVPVFVITLALHPILFLINKIVSFFMNTIERFFFKDSVKDIVDEAEILATVDISLEDGGIDEQDYAQIKGILHLDDKMVSEISTPINLISSVKAETLVSENIEYLCNSQHSRVLIMDESNTPIGYLHVKTALSLHIQGNNLMVKDMLLPIISVQDNEIVDDVLNKLTVINFVNGISFQQYISVVNDKFGNLAGLVTLEDIQEEVFGQIYDETDHCVDLRVAIDSEENNN